MKAPVNAKPAPKRDLFAELSEGMIALALLRSKPRKAGTKTTVVVTFQQRRGVGGAIADQCLASGRHRAIRGRSGEAVVDPIS
ncbi:MAG: hypothetical protein D4R74_13865 [Betaproteobacteria bacterium]|nr:MAG: hypothetical protein D4R74_13865 [Betaproteobacteria bacterium]